MKYQLMFKDEVRALFSIDVNRGIEDIHIDTILGRLPIGQIPDTLSIWITDRNAIAHRAYLTEYLDSVNKNTISGFLSLTHGISLNDCFWMKRVDEDLTWNQISPYKNPFDETLAQLSFEGDGESPRLRRVVAVEDHGSISPEFTTNGQFDKCWIRENDDIFMLKRGYVEDESDVYAGREPYNEVLASQVFVAMRAGIPYTLVKHHGKTASKCKLFNTEDYSFASLATVSRARGFINVSQYMSCLPNGELYRRMIVCDALVLNIDRHRNNMGVFYRAADNKIISCGTGFDYNLSFFPHLLESEFGQIQKKMKARMPRMKEASFLQAANYVMTDEIRNDLLNLRGIELKLPFYSETFTEKYAALFTDVVNYQIDRILYPDRIITFGSRD